MGRIGEVCRVGEMGHVGEMGDVGKMGRVGEMGRVGKMGRVNNCFHPTCIKIIAKTSVVFLVHMQFLF